MEEVKFFLLSLPLKAKTKKKNFVHDHEFAHFADFPTVASFRLTAVSLCFNCRVNSACTIFYYLFFYSFELF